MIRPALDSIRELEGGTFLDKLDVEYHTLIQEIRKTDKKGTLRITLEVSPIKGDASMVTITPVIEVKAPKPDPQATMFYTTPDANTQRRDPRQREIQGLDVVERKTDPIDPEEQRGAK